MFKVGDIVEVNPNWQDIDHDNHGITNWRDYLGHRFTVCRVWATGSVSLKGNPYFWSSYMLRYSHSIKRLLEEKNGD